MLEKLGRVVRTYIVACDQRHFTVGICIEFKKINVTPSRYRSKRVG